MYGSPSGRTINKNANGIGVVLSHPSTILPDTVIVVGVSGVGCCVAWAVAFKVGSSDVCIVAFVSGALLVDVGVNQPVAIHFPKVHQLLGRIGVIPEKDG